MSFVLEVGKSYVREKKPYPLLTRIIGEVEEGTFELKLHKLDQILYTGIAELGKYTALEIHTTTKPGPIINRQFRIVVPNEPMGREEMVYHHPLPFLSDTVAHLFEIIS